MLEEEGEEEMCVCLFVCLFGLILSEVFVFVRVLSARDGDDGGFVF